MKMIKQTPLLQILINHQILLLTNTHPHIQHNIRVPQVADNLHLLKEVPSPLLVEPRVFLAELLDSYVLAQPLAPENLPVAALPHLL
jgi:hypothetical protein